MPYRLIVDGLMSEVRRYATNRPSFWYENAVERADKANLLIEQEGLGMSRYLPYMLVIEGLMSEINRKASDRSPFWYENAVERADKARILKRGHGVDIDVANLGYGTIINGLVMEAAHNITQKPYGKKNATQKANRAMNLATQYVNDRVQELTASFQQMGLSLEPQKI